LKNGLGFLKQNYNDITYIQFQNLKQVKNNAKEVLNLNLVVLNQKSGVYHKLDCKHVELMSFGKIISSNLIEKQHKACQVCHKNSKISDIKIDFDYKIPKTSNVYKKSFLKKVDNIEIFLVNPLEFKKPNANCETPLCRAIVNEINNSQKTIDVALYGVGQQNSIINALKNAKQRGVTVRSVVDYSEKMDSLYPNTIQFAHDFNAQMDKTETLMHNKFFIFDDKKVLTGSANVSSTGTGGYNSNNAVLIESDEIALLYKEEFEKMYKGKFSINKTPTRLFDNNLIKPYFSPKDDILNVILNEIKKAKNKIYVSIFYLTDKKLIQELINAKKRGVEVLILIDSLGASNFKERIQAIRANGIPVIIENWGGKNHEKTIVVDGKILIVGSCNFSKSGFYKNDENIVVIKNKDVAQKYEDYFLYLINSIDKKYFVSFPRPEGFESKNSCNDGIDNNFDGKIDKDDIGCIAQ